jgi:hypothetical protein
MGEILYRIIASAAVLYVTSMVCTQAVRTPVHKHILLRSCRIRWVR